MDFKDYLAILESENLEESPLADGVLVLAMDSKCEEEKIEYIFQAIDLARMAKDDKEFRQMVHEEFERIEGYRHKGFLHEFKMMKGR